MGGLVFGFFYEGSFYFGPILAQHQQWLQNEVLRFQALKSQSPDHEVFGLLDVQGKGPQIKDSGQVTVPSPFPG